MSIYDVGPNCYIFKFIDEATPKRIMEDSPWNVIGHLLNLQWWHPWCSISEVEYNVVPFWVQAHGIPLEALNVKAATKIGSRLRILLEVEDPVVDGKILRSFVCMRILVNIAEPLTTGFWVLRN